MFVAAYSLILDALGIRRLGGAFHRINDTDDASNERKKAIHAQYFVLIGDRPTSATYTRSMYALIALKINC